MSWKRITMNPICLCLLLPIVCVISLPTQYDTTDNHELPKTFWTHHFGPDFEDAIHMDLEQTDLIDNGNVIERPDSEPEQKEGNKKRSAYSVHKSFTSEQQHRTLEDSVKVHTLQPGEVEAMEKEMFNYAKFNKLAKSPVVVNLPASEGSVINNGDYETPVVLNVPPVVYHNHGNIIQPQYLGKTSWSHKEEYPSYQKLQSSYEKIQSQFASPFGQNPYSYEENKQHSHEDENRNPLTYDNFGPSNEENRKTAYEDRTHPTPKDQSEGQQDTTPGNNDETA